MYSLSLLKKEWTRIEWTMWIYIEPWIALGIIADIERLRLTATSLHNTLSICLSYGRYYYYFLLFSSRCVAGSAVIASVCWRSLLAVRWCTRVEWSVIHRKRALDTNQLDDDDDDDSWECSWIVRTTVARSRENKEKGIIDWQPTGHQPKCILCVGKIVRAGRPYTQYRIHTHTRSSAFG